METETLYQKLLKQGYEEFGLADQLEPGRSIINLFENKAKKIILKSKAKEVKAHRYKDLEPEGTRYKPDDIILFYK